MRGGKWFTATTLLLALLIVVVWFHGFTSDVGAVSGFVNSAANVFTGRPPAGGAFANYPQQVG